MRRLLLEPSDPHVPGGSVATARLAATAAAFALLFASTGDGLSAAVLLGVAAADMVAGTVAVLAVLGALARFGTTSLAGLAGAQAVLGPGIGVSPAIGALASGLAGLACVAAAPRDWRGYPFGVLAAVVAFGPAATGMGDGLLRAAGLVLGIGLVVLRNRFVPDVPWWAPVGAAVLALVLAVVA